MQLFRKIFGLFILTLLAACGGGGEELSRGDSSNGGGSTTDPVYAVSISITGQSSSTSPLSYKNKGVVTIKVTKDGSAVSNATLTLGISGPGVLGADSLSTNSSGIATTEITPTSTAGTGSVTVQFVVGSVAKEASAQFVSAGTLYEIALGLLDTTGEEIVNREISQSKIGVLTAAVTVDGAPLAFKKIVFDMDSSIGVLNPTSGTALTDANGKAQINVLPGVTEGAGRISATYANVVETYDFYSKGDGVPAGSDTNYKLTLKIVDSATNSDTTLVSSANPAKVQATLTNLLGEVQIGKVISFSSSLGVIKPASATALTDSSGIAEVLLTAGTVEGAGTISAVYSGVSSASGFKTLGDEIDRTELDVDLDFRILSGCADTFRTSRNPAECSTTPSISADNPGVLYVKATKKGSTVALPEMLVSATTSLGDISPKSKTAITDSNGVAILDLVAGSDVGAGEATVTLLNASITKAFEIGAADVTLTLTTEPESGVVEAGSTIIVYANINKPDGSPYTFPLEVEFTSNCVKASTATIDSNVVSVGGIALATYKAQGCKGNDTISVSAITGGNSVIGNKVITVNESAVGSLEFVSATPESLVLKGSAASGGKESSVVLFKLVDKNGNPVSGKNVNFKLATSVGDVTVSPVTATTNSLGEVSTTVNAGYIPTSVVVIATYADTTAGIELQAPSSRLVVSTGLADQNSFSLSVTSSNVNALSVDGETSTVNIYLSDHFGNPVPDGTVVNFNAEGGQVTSACNTTKGRCNVTWTGTNPRPFYSSGYANGIAEKCADGLPCPFGIIEKNASGPFQPEVGGQKWGFDLPLAGRATITAYAIGEESFFDRNGNGLFDEGDFVSDYDTSEAFRDYNEDGLYKTQVAAGCTGDNPNGCDKLSQSIGDEFEEFVDFNKDSQFDLANGVYDGSLCLPSDDAAGKCKRTSKNVFDNLEIVMSDNVAFFRAVTWRETADPSVTVCKSGNGLALTPVRYNSKDSDRIVINGLEMCNVLSIDLNPIMSDDDGDPLTPDVDVGTTSVTVTVFVADQNNNPLPKSSSIVISSDNGQISGSGTTTFPDSTSRVPASYTFTIAREVEGNKKSTGAATVKVTSPDGVVSSLSIAVYDAG